MADNSTLPATGDVIAADDIGGVKYQRMKPTFGTDGSATDVSTSNPLPVVQTGTPSLPTGAATSAKQDTLAGLIGEVQASPTSNTLLDRVKALLTGIVLAAGDNLIGRFKLSDGTTVASVADLTNANPLHVAVVDSSGNQVTSFSGGGTQYAEDAVHANGDSGTLALVVRKDTAASTAGSDGDYAALVVGSDGGLWVRQSQPLPAGTNAIGKLAANDGVDIGDVTATNLPATVDTNSGNKSASTLRVVLATDQPSLSNALPASQSGTWTVQPGNTANTTAWLVKTQRAATPTQSSVAGNASSTTILASNSSRLGATIYNDSSAVLYLKLGATASTSSFTAILAGNGSGVGGYFEVPFGYTGVIDGIWSSATGNARITELT